MKNQHTPGPWNASGFNIETATANYLIQGHSMVKAEELRANARLIAAAPEMLEALGRALDRLQHVEGNQEDIIEILNDAIAEAEGVK